MHSKCGKKVSLFASLSCDLQNGQGCTFAVAQWNQKSVRATKTSLSTSRLLTLKKLRTISWTVKHISYNKGNHTTKVRLARLTVMLWPANLKHIHPVITQDFQLWDGLFSMMRETQPIFFSILMCSLVTLTNKNASYGCIQVYCIISNTQILFFHQSYSNFWEHIRWAQFHYEGCLHLLIFSLSYRYGLRI